MTQLWRQDKILDVLYHRLLKYRLHSVFAALPGEGGGSGAGGSRREAAAGGDPHGPGGGSAQQPQTPGSGKLPQCPTGQPSTGTHTHTHARHLCTFQ